VAVGSGIKDGLGKFGPTLSELPWSESVGWSGVDGWFGQAIWMCRGVVGFNSHQVVGGVGLRRKIRSFEELEIGDSEKKRGEEIF
jgi:hypothetical protein